MATTREGERTAIRRAAALALAAVACVLMSAEGAAQAQMQAPAQAQPGAEPRIATLRQAFEAAWQRQPEARSAGARRQAVDARGAIARGLTAEPMALELSARTDRFTRNHGGREYEAGIAFPLWLPGERGGLQAVAQAEFGALDTRVAAARWRLAGAVREAWWAVQRATLETTLAQVRLDHARQLAADVARRVKAGDLARTDQQQADGAVAAAQSALAVARATRIEARLALRAHTGAVPEDILPAAAEELPAAPPATAAPVSRAAERDHPALRELAARADLARRTRDLASLQTRGNPELTIATTRERGAFGETYSQSLIVGVRIPFGSVDRQHERVAGALAELTEAETQIELEQARVAAEIATAEAQVEAARAVLDAAATRAALAAETRRALDKSFRLGETDFPTRLRVDLEAIEAERQHESARIDLARAVSRWRQASGLLPE